MRLQGISVSIRYHKIRLAAHLARAADDIANAIATALTTLEAKEAAEETQETILGSTSSTQAGGLLVVVFAVPLLRR